MNHDEIKTIAMLLKAELQPEWMTASEVAKHLRVGQKWVRQHIAELGGKMIPGTKQNLRFPRAVVDRVLVEGKLAA